MIPSKRGRWAIFLCILPGALCLVLGCGGATPTTRPVAGGKSGSEDPLESARETFRKANDAPTFREALHLVNAHLSRDAEASARLQKIKEEQDRALPPQRLREVFGLEPDELEYLELTTFQPLDAHYLVQACELRDAARALPVQQLPRLQQAELAFAWVMRQVMLRESNDDLVPPHYVLLSGQGTARERALVFLGLLQQLNLDGCLIAVPGDAPNRPRFWAAGVLIEDKGKGDIYLFDTRLGLPLPGPGGKGIATLAQVKAQPELLRQLTVDKESPYDITPEQARGAEVYPACPLSALAPRMKLLADLLSTFDRVQLAIDPASLLDRLETAAKSKVRSLNQPTTPARALGRFMPAEEGGVDKTAKAQRYVQQTLPSAAVVRSLRDLRLLEELPAPAAQQLLHFADVLYGKYVVIPHDYLVRGRLDETTRRLVQTLTILREFDDALLPDAEFVRDVAQWRERAKKAYVDVIRQVPDAQRAMEALWYEDQHLQMLLAPTADERERQKTPKKTLTFIVVRSVADPLRNDASYLLALCWQEKAERLETQRLRHARQGKDDERANAWLNAQDWCRKYAGQYPFSTASINGRLGRLNDFRNPMELIQAVPAWERLFRELRAGFHARLLQARGLEASGKTGARALLQSLAADLSALRKDAELTQALGVAMSRAEGLKNAVVRQGGPEALLGDLHSRLADLERDLGPGGSFGWMRATALYRLSTHSASAQ